MEPSSEAIAVALRPATRQRGEDGAEFTEKSERNGVGGEGRFAEAAELASGVEDDDASDAE